MYQVNIISALTVVLGQYAVQYVYVCIMCIYKMFIIVAYYCIVQYSIVCQCIYMYSNVYTQFSNCYVYIIEQYILSCICYISMYNLQPHSSYNIQQYTFICSNIPASYAYAYTLYMYVYIVALACGGFPSPAQNITPFRHGLSSGHLVRTATGSVYTTGYGAEVYISC